MKQVISVAVQARKRWVIASIPNKFVDHFSFMGLYQTKYSYSYKLPQSNVHEMRWIALADIQKLICGVGINPFFWKNIYAQWLSFFSLQQDYELTPMDNLRIAIYRISSPIFQFFLGRWILRSFKLRLLRKEDNDQ
jgi:hypothetical protein